MPNLFALPGLDATCSLPADLVNSYSSFNTQFKVILETFPQDRKALVAHLLGPEAVCPPLIMSWGWLPRIERVTQSVPGRKGFPGATELKLRSQTLSLPNCSFKGSAAPKM